MTHVKVTKLARLPNRPDGELITEHEIRPIIEGYEVKGYCKDLPRVGFRFSVDRYERNGVKMLGEFSTSPVVSIELADTNVSVFMTQNSVYRVDLL